MDIKKNTAEQTDVEKEKSFFKKHPYAKIYIKCFILSILYTIGLSLFFVGIFVTGNTLENLLFYAKVPLEDGSPQALTNCLYFCLPAAVIMFVSANLFPHLAIKHKEKIKERSKKSKRGFPLKQIRFLYNHGFLMSFISIILSIIFFGFQTNAWEFIAASFRTSQIYEENYVAPQDQTYVFPEEKKNLVYIFLESMETSFASVEEGGFMEENYIPHLTQLAKDNISFSDTEKLGGLQPITGTAWTVAAMVSQTSGVPLTIPISKSTFGKDNTFLPGLYTVGQVLEKGGYDQTLLIGSNASFARRNDYFEEHGNYKIFDYEYAQRMWKMTGELPENYRVWWGYEDFRLFDYAREEIERFVQTDKPFNLTMLTVDTHFTDGYKCEYCPETFDNQYANVINCSDDQIYDFVSWILNHENPEISENTVIVLCGDHLTMDHAYFNSVDSDVKERGRRVYNCFINTGLSTEHTKNRVFTSLDMFPTTLAALGISWGNNQLALGVNLFSGAPTLSEKFGIDEFSYQLASSSKFYNEYIMDKNYQKYNLSPDEYDDEMGPSDDSRTGEIINREQKEKEKMAAASATP